MRLMFFSDNWKFNVAYKNAKKKKKQKRTKKNISEIFYGFFNNLIRIGNGKFSLLL